VAEERAAPVADDSRRALLIGLMGLVLIYLYHAYSYLFLNDDAFISFRYALNWAESGEPVYNLGERVEGYTNFLWVALLALIGWLGGEIPSWGLWLGLPLGLLSLALSARLSWRLGGGSERPTRAGLAALFSVGLLALSPSFACWSSGGLEVQLFTALSLASLLITSRALERDEPALAALGGGLGALTCMSRPEGLLLMGLIGLISLLSCLRSRRLARRAELSWLGALLCLYLPYWLWRSTFYGYPLPNTYYVKEGAQSLWAPGARYLLSWLSAHPWLALGLASLSMSLKSRRRASEPRAQLTPAPHAAPQSLPLLAGLWALCLCLHVAHVGGDFMANHRFLTPITPLCAALISPQLAAALFWLRERWLSPRLCLGLGFTLFAALSLSARLRYQETMRGGSAGGVDSIGWLKTFVSQCEQLGRWIDQNSPAEARIATTAAGAIAYYARRPTLDLLGLNDEWIAHQVPARGSRPGHTKSAPLSYVLSQDIDLLIYHPVMAASPPRPHPSYRRALEPRGYRWRVFQPPKLDPPYWGLWVKEGLKLPQRVAPLSPSKRATP